MILCVLDRKSCEEPPDIQRSFQSRLTHTQKNKGSHLEMHTPFRLHTIWKRNYLCVIEKVPLFPLVKERQRKTAWAEMSHYNNDVNWKAKAWILSFLKWSGLSRADEKVRSMHRNNSNQIYSEQEREDAIMTCWYRPAVITVWRPEGNYYSVISDTNKQKTQNGLYTKSIQKPDKRKLMKIGFLQKMWVVLAHGKLHFLRF